MLYHIRMQRELKISSICLHAMYDNIIHYKIYLS